MDLRHKLFIRNLIALLIGCSMGGGGCSRHWFREAADADAYHLIDSRQRCEDWSVPVRVVEPDPQSRMADRYDADCGPRPPDDPGAECWMTDLHGRPLKYYERIAQSSTIESEEWMSWLPRDDEGKVDVNRETAVALALLHSREYQSQVEQVYLNALGLSANRFEFMVQWLGGIGGDYTANGADLGPSGGSLSSDFGLTRNLAAGGQIAANLLNSITWTAGGGNSITGSLALSLTQPLLRGAFKHVRLEGLTQAERDLLYQVRDFAHFRREFYLTVTQSYLRLLTQTQAVRNQRSNLENLELNLREHEELFSRQMVSQIQVDQVFQQYQSGRIDLFSAEQGFASALDAFKFQLGLPADVEIKLDESLLRSFELTSPELDKLQKDVQARYQELVQFLPPEPAPLDKLQDLIKEFLSISKSLESLLPGVEKELNEWQAKLKSGGPANASAETKLDLEQQAGLAKQVAAALEDLKNEIEKDARSRDQWLNELEKLPEKERWEWAGREIAQRLREQVGTLFVVQTQSRLFLLEVPRFDLGQAAAVELATGRRLDLMNQQAQVTDAFRKIEVAADALQSGLDLQAGATLQPQPGHDNPIAFDASAARYTVGLRFDGPLNRFEERNSYRASQIAYQQTRRAYMAAKDSVANQIRLDIRNLRVNELNFQIARQQLITAIRQVEEAQFNLRITTEPNSNLTRDLLQALQGLLGAKNNLISSWIEYEVGRIQLFVDLEILQLDENGLWLNQNENPGEAESYVNSIPDPANRSDRSGASPGPQPSSAPPESAEPPASDESNQLGLAPHPLLGFGDPERSNATSGLSSRK